MLPLDSDRSVNFNNLGLEVLLTLFIALMLVRIYQLLIEKK